MATSSGCLPTLPESLLASALILITPEEIGRRLDLERFDADYVVEHYRNMRNLIVRAAADGLGLILYIN